MWLTTSLVVVLGSVLMSRWVKAHETSYLAAIIAAATQQVQGSVLGLEKRLGSLGLLHSLRTLTTK